MRVDTKRELYWWALTLFIVIPSSLIMHGQPRWHLVIMGVFVGIVTRIVANRSAL